MIKELYVLTKNLFQLHEYKYEQYVIFNHPNQGLIEVSFVINDVKRNRCQINGKTGVLVKEKTSIITILQTDIIKEKTQLSRMIVIANQFPSEVKELAEKLGIITFSKHELLCIKSLYELKQSADIAFDG